MGHNYQPRGIRKIIYKITTRKMKDLKKNLIEAISSLINAKNISAVDNIISFNYQGNECKIEVLDSESINLTIGGNTEYIKCYEYAEEVVYDRVA